MVSDEKLRQLIEWCRPRDPDEARVKQPVGSWCDLTSALEELLLVRADAARYRWLRENVVGASVVDYPHITVQFPAGVRLWLDKYRFNESVDAAMAKEKSGE